MPVSTIYDNMKPEELAVLVRQAFEICLMPDFCRYMYSYCRSNNVLHTEACKHIIVQEYISSISLN